MCRLARSIFAPEIVNKVKKVNEKERKALSQKVLLGPRKRGIVDMLTKTEVKVPSFSFV